ncbi:VC0807 family protein [Gordonia sp. CPCC 206044]|uniref:VC0807 family protein n=1 Tax=Gordonia sp. CPCC 206044 TaxID=3140793 RepID=UPI003AF33E7D
MNAADTTSEISRLRREHSARKGLWFNIVITCVEVGGAIVLFRLARSAGASEVAAYLLGSVAPIVGALSIWLRSRRFSGASAAILAFTLMSAVVTVVGSTAPKMLLYKDCAVTAVIGIIFAASCLLAKPVLFYFAQRYASDGTRDGMRVFDLMWEANPRFRTAMYAMSLAWAVTYLVQAGVTSVVIAETPFDTAYTWDQILPMVATAVAVVCTVAIGRRMRAPAGSAT